MTRNDDILLRPAAGFAFIRVLPFLLLALALLLLAWWLSPYFVPLSLSACGVSWYKFLSIRSARYLIATAYIRISRGILFKRIDQAELFRVKDYIITCPLWLQALGLMNLTLKTTDPESPVIRIDGIPKSDITDIIRERVLSARKDNNIYELN